MTVEGTVAIPLPMPAAIMQLKMLKEHRDEMEKELMSSVKSLKKVAKPREKTTTGKIKLTAHSHPSYLLMVRAAIRNIADPHGSSRAAMLKYIAQHYKVGENVVQINAHIRNAIKKGTESGALTQIKGHGASGSFKLGEKQLGKAETKPRVTVKKPTVKKSTTKAKKTAAKKEAPKKTKTVKKTTAKTAEKKTTTKKTIGKKGKKGAAKKGKKAAMKTTKTTKKATA